MNILVFNDTLYEEFRRKKIELSEQLIKYEDSKFEIITQTYNFGIATFQGWPWTGDMPVQCVMEIFFSGDMLYILDENQYHLPKTKKMTSPPKSPKRDFIVEETAM